MRGSSLLLCMTLGSNLMQRCTCSVIPLLCSRTQLIPVIPLFPALCCSFPENHLLASLHEETVWNRMHEARGDSGKSKFWMSLRTNMRQATFFLLLCSTIDWARTETALFLRFFEAFKCSCRQQNCGCHPMHVSDLLNRMTVLVEFLCSQQKCTDLKDHLKEWGVTF